MYSGALILMTCVLLLAPSDAVVYKIKAGQPFFSGSRTSVSQGPGGTRVVDTDTYVNEGVSNSQPMPSLFQNGLLPPLNLNMRL